jgi:DNA-binding transcriptional LysR family regulator
VASSDYIGLASRRLAEQYPGTLRWFPIRADLPEVEVQLRWHARLDADPAQRWLRETVRTCV